MPNHDYDTFFIYTPVYGGLDYRGTFGDVLRNACLQLCLAMASFCSKVNRNSALFIPQTPLKCTRSQFRGISVW